MADSTLIPFLEAGTTDRSVLVGAPEDFDFPAALKGANIIRLANAFGHMSGWNEIKESLLESGASNIQILLGQAFYQTEPALILALKELQSTSSGPAIEVKLASAVATFHPKVLIVAHPSTPFCIVGSGNLSRGGLLSNVECGLFTSHLTDIDALNQWFATQWAGAPPFCRHLRKIHSGLPLD